MSKYSFLKLILVFVSVSLGKSFLFGQLGGCYKAEELKSKFLKTKTLVVLSGNENFDLNVKKGMEEYWTFTDFEFVEAQKLKEIGKDANYSVLRPYDLEVTENGNSQTYPRWGLILPAETNSRGVSGIVADVFIDHFGREQKYDDGAYRAKHMVKFISNYLSMILSGELTGSCNAYDDILQKFFVSNAYKVKEKTLLVDEAFLTKGVKEAFVANYKGKIEFVKTDIIEEAINAKDSSFCYLLPIFTNHKYIYIVDAETGDINYELNARYGMLVTAKDVKTICAQIFKQ